MGKSKRYSLRGGKYKSRKIRKSNKQRKSRNIKRTRKINNKRKGGVFGMGFNKNLSNRSNWNEIVNTVTDPKNVDKTFSMTLIEPSNNPKEFKGFILEPYTILYTGEIGSEYELLTVEKLGKDFAELKKTHPNEILIEELKNLQQQRKIITLQNKINNNDKLWLLEPENNNVIDVYYLYHGGIKKYKLYLKSKLNRSQSVGDLVQDMSVEQIEKRNTY